MAFAIVTCELNAAITTAIDGLRVTGQASQYIMRGPDVPGVRRFEIKDLNPLGCRGAPPPFVLSRCTKAVNRQIRWPEMKIGYISHNLNDPAVERRCRMLNRGGAKVALAGFCRDPAVAAAPAARDPMLLGQSQDANLLRRALETVRSAVFTKALVRRFADCDVIMARNLEQLAIAYAIAGDRPIVYECLDVHRLLTGSGKAASLIRAIEGRLLAKVDLLLTSSPGFVRNHFTQRPVRAPIAIIENKLLIDDDVQVDARPAAPELPVRIGWFGMLRCKRTLAFLTELVERADGRVEVLIAGKPSPAELPDITEKIGAVRGMTFHGSYHYDDLPELYGRCHFAWTIDWFEEGLNSSWLLPNRLYEALAHGAIPIALTDVETGRWLAAHDCGLLVDRAPDAAKRLATMAPSEITGMQQRVSALDRRELMADSRDCQDLVNTIGATLRA
ncbi:glycosyltransferase family protein [Sphingomonas qomolangmaensis]|uniref:Glycosyl transferase family 1 n=1 Tax=Sphingomonas qomolangmaensis TaxID=2918765 RepID=A0ABY5L8V0_9SPHN|nr:hypothetical protein [Sphingomonas qomolangmaensis]UUL82391.1 hypothetical protein NMP03_14630 [Sphingomonas qomolangmaensis]